MIADMLGTITYDPEELAREGILFLSDDKLLVTKEHVRTHLTPKSNLTALEQRVYELERAAAQEPKLMGDGITVLEPKLLDSVYGERDACVAVIAKMAQLLGWSAWMGRHEDEEGSPPWDDEWRNIVFVHVPGYGQWSWHVHDREVHLFSEIPCANTAWDGHTTEAKYQSMAKFAGSTP